MAENATFFLGRQVTTKNDDSPGGSDIARSHKTGEVACYGDEGENVRGLDGIKTEPDTEKQREFQMASWGSRNSHLYDR